MSYEPRKLGTENETNQHGEQPLLIANSDNYVDTDTVEKIIMIGYVYISRSPLLKPCSCLIFIHW